MRFTANGNHVECRFDIPGYGKGVELITSDQARALIKQLERSIDVAEVE